MSTPVAPDPQGTDPDTIVVLTEEALDDGDAARIAALHAGQRLTYRVLVPADTERNLLTDVLDHLSLLELRETLDALRGKDHGHADEPREAREALARSVAVLSELGVSADGEVTEDDPIPALRNAVHRFRAREVIVVTRPHAVEDTFHRDWASRARDELGVPVLHVYAGTTFLG